VWQAICAPRDLDAPRIWSYDEENYRFIFPCFNDRV